MESKLTFYKEQERWYADIPEVSKEDNEMVLGADVFLDKVSLGYDSLEIIFSDININKFEYAFKLINHDECGGTYANVKNENETMWLCNVTHLIFSEHPEMLYVKSIKIK